MRRRACLYLAGLTAAGIAVGERNDLVLASSELEARFSPDGVLREVLAIASGERFSMASPEQFRFSTATEEIRVADCRRAGLSPAQGWH